LENICINFEVYQNKTIMEASFKLILTPKCFLTKEAERSQR